MFCRVFLPPLFGSVCAVVDVGFLVRVVLMRGVKIRRVEVCPTDVDELLEVGVGMSHNVYSCDSKIDRVVIR